MKKEKEFFRLFQILIFSLLLFLNSTALLAGEFEYDVKIEQLDLFNLSAPVPNSTIGLLTISYAPITDPIYMNFVARNDIGDPIWIVKNLYLPSNTFSAIKQEISVRFGLTELGYKTGDDVAFIPLYVHLSEKILTSPPTPGLYDKVAVVDLIEDAFNEIIVGAGSTVIELPEELKFTDDEKMADVVYRGCEVPFIDLDNATFPANEKYAGDLLACAPASAASSLKWLDKVHDDIVITGDERNVLQDLSALMERKPGHGVPIENFIKGKLDYIEKNELKINVKFQTVALTKDISSTSGKTTARNEKGEGAFPTWEWLQKQLNEGEDVEIMYYWKDGLDWRGQAVVVTGYELTNEGRLRLKFKHDLYQAGAGGTRQECDDLILDSEKKMILIQHHAVIVSAVAESPGTPYPVELSAFVASVEKNSVYLNWQTASETNNYGFELFRSDVQVAFVPGNGTTVAAHDYRFIDQSLKPGVYEYKLFQIDFDGTRTLAGKVEVAIQNVPVTFNLSQNYPNPFNASTRISFSLPEKEMVRLTIYNVLGKEIARVLNEEKLAGPHEFMFDASELTSGIYYYKLEAGSFTEMRKFVLLK
ncbi:T9SS type A sorting domain-containing protein [candidate division KSB1 bacterium]|nr:T9SS type A sorting domain-containing protein [candidate division KSB1 bacterium]